MHAEQNTFPRMRLLQSSLPFTFMANSIHKDMLMGVIYSQVDSLKPAEGPVREEFDGGLYLLSHMSFVNDYIDIPAFSRQKQILEELELDTQVFMGTNEQIIRKAFAGKDLAVNNMFDIVNIEETIKTMYCIDSYDLNKMSPNKILYRSGYHDESSTINKAKRPLHRLPVLSDENKIFGSQFGSINHAPLDEDSKNILTVVFGFGLSIADLDEFSSNLISLKTRQETDCSSKTIKMAIISGYPSVYEYNNEPRPRIVCGY